MTRRRPCRFCGITERTEEIRPDMRWPNFEVVVQRCAKCNRLVGKWSRYKKEQG